jgi:hypothetical protein
MCNEIFHAPRDWLRGPPTGIRTKWTAWLDGLALVQLAHGVFNMLAQQAALFRRHMTVAAALIEIWGNCGAHHDV